MQIRQNCALNVWSCRGQWAMHRRCTAAAADARFRRTTPQPHRCSATLSAPNTTTMLRLWWYFSAVHSCLYAAGHVGWVSLWCTSEVTCGYALLFLTI